MNAIGCCLLVRGFPELRGTVEASVRIVNPHIKNNDEGKSKNDKCDYPCL